MKNMLYLYPHYTHHIWNNRIENSTNVYVYTVHAATVILWYLNPHKFIFLIPLNKYLLSMCQNSMVFFFSIQFHCHPSGALIFFLTRTVIQMSSFLMVSFVIRGEKHIPLGSGRGLTLSQKIILYYIILCV
jgi:hypothetical protein